MSSYYIKGRPYYLWICPFCGKREAVLWEDGLSRSCRFCGVRWNEWAGEVRLIEAKCNMQMQKSYISGVENIPFNFAQYAEYLRACLVSP